MIKIAFTSCTRYEAFKEQREWNYISEKNPDYLFLLGDNIYMDYGVKGFSHEPNGSPEFLSDEEFEAKMRMKYTNQFKRVPEFNGLVQKMRGKNGFYGIWDDHDFAWDNVKGFEVRQEKKEISRALFHEFLDCSTNLPHTYYHIDTELARVIFIDNRWDAEKKGENTKIISDEQFEFIADKLNHNKQYTLFCGGLTLTKGSENWKKYPSQLKRLCDLIEGKPNVLFLGGDIHKNAWVKAKYIGKIEATTPVQLISSGMAVNYVGLGLSFDDRHNWATLSISKNEVKVDFFKRNTREDSRSNKANSYLRIYLNQKN